MKGRHDTVRVPLSINLSKNLSPDFSINCVDSCSIPENSASGVSIINLNRTDNDSDEINYSLENTFNNKFSINSNTGEVTLNESLDYENSSSYNIKIIGTDSKGKLWRKMLLFLLMILVQIIRGI